jgi:hypothetical protein
MDGNAIRHFTPAKSGSGGSCSTPADLDHYDRLIRQEQAAQLADMNDLLHLLVSRLDEVLRRNNL